VNEDSCFRLIAHDNAVAKAAVAIQLEHDSPTVLVETEGKSRRLILDTGSNIPILQPGVSRGDVSHHNGAVWSDCRRLRYQRPAVSLLRAK
jgi:hypothetical protein